MTNFEKIKQIQSTIINTCATVIGNIHDNLELLKECENSATK